MAKPLSGFLVTIERKDNNKQKKERNEDGRERQIERDDALRFIFFGWVPGRDNAKFFLNTDGERERVRCSQPPFRRPP